MKQKFPFSFIEEDFLISEQSIKSGEALKISSEETRIGVVFLFIFIFTLEILFETFDYSGIILK